MTQVCSDLSLGGDSESSGSSKYSRRGDGDLRPGLRWSGVSAHTHRRKAGLPGRERAGDTLDGLSCGR